MDRATDSSRVWNSVVEEVSLEALVDLIVTKGQVASCLTISTCLSGDENNRP